ncbi:hypothetical protein L2E82_10822 [Cichorium intybus]|uniref:Uncharacterized protein n=1 Tax=Cichorium intybus TaxID=13427 RepID=A0ACB9GCQ8_CICIN|nr:hypothetical protein L2E82_10822 [Cichorium intybus]
MPDKKYSMDIERKVSNNADDRLMINPSSCVKVGRLVRLYSSSHCIIPVSASLKSFVGWGSLLCSRRICLNLRLCSLEGDAQRFSYSGGIHLKSTYALGPITRFQE